MGNRYAHFQEQVADASRIGTHFSVCFEVLKKRSVPEPLLRMLWDVKRNVLVAVKFLQDDAPVRLLDPAEFAQAYAMLVAIDQALSGGDRHGPAARAATVDEAKEENECPVCMEATAVVVLPCSHAFCKKCLDDWTSRDDTCPLCRTALETEEEHWHLTEGTKADFVRDQLQALRALILSRPIAENAVLPASLAARPQAQQSTQIAPSALAAPPQQAATQS
mmetsp:Transcript_17320/g.55609  ORF Transcript_17320/g.55609 Transcript_17320/m.55609 type:complete len:221 (-) Transcript_17320:113-775(-)